MCEIAKMIIPFVWFIVCAYVMPLARLCYSTVYTQYAAIDLTIFEWCDAATPPGRHYPNKCEYSGKYYILLLLILLLGVVVVGLVVKYPRIIHDYMGTFIRRSISK